MRYPASEKLEIIRLVEESHLSARLTLAKLGIPRTTFYRWYDRYLAAWRGWPEGSISQAQTRLEPHSLTRCGARSLSSRLKETSCRRENWPSHSQIKKAILYQKLHVIAILKAHDLITSPAFIVYQRRPSEFKDKTTAINQLWQTDFTYLKVLGWGWFYLSTILDDYSRYIISWKLCTNMRTEDVTTRSIWPCRHRVATRFMSSTSRVC